MENKEEFIRTHLTNSLIEIIHIGEETAICKVKTPDGQKNVIISLPNIELTNFISEEIHK
jgi:hypothetical protein